MVQRKSNLILSILLVSLTSGLESSAFRTKAWKHVSAHKLIYGGLTTAGSFIALRSFAKAYEQLENPERLDFVGRKIESYLDPSYTLEDGRHIVPVHYIKLPRGGIRTPDAVLPRQTALVCKTRKGGIIDLETEYPHGKTLHEWRMKGYITDHTTLVLEAWRKHDPTKPNLEANDTVKVFLPFDHIDCDISISRAWAFADHSDYSGIKSYIKIEAQHRKIAEFKSYVYLATSNDTIDISVEDFRERLPAKLNPLLAWIFYRDSFKVHSDKTVRHIEKRPQESRYIRDIWNSKPAPKPTPPNPHRTFTDIEIVKY